MNIIEAATSSFNADHLIDSILDALLQTLSDGADVTRIQRNFFANITRIGNFDTPSDLYQSRGLLKLPLESCNRDETLLCLYAFTSTSYLMIASSAFASS